MGLGNQRLSFVWILWKMETHVTHLSHLNSPSIIVYSHHVIDGYSKWEKSYIWTCFRTFTTGESFNEFYIGSVLWHQNGQNSFWALVACLGSPHMKQCLLHLESQMRFVSWHQICASSFWVHPCLPGIQTKFSSYEVAYAPVFPLYLCLAYNVACQLVSLLALTVIHTKRC